MSKTFRHSFLKSLLSMSTPVERFFENLTKFQIWQKKIKKMVFEDHFKIYLNFLTSKFRISGFFLIA